MTRSPPPSSRIVPPQRDAVRQALARSPADRAAGPRGLRLAWLLGAAGLGVALAFGSLGSTTSGDGASTGGAAPISKTAREDRIRAAAELARSEQGGARRAVVTLRVLWQADAFDRTVAERELATWLGNQTSRAVIEASCGRDSGLFAALAPAFSGDPEVTVFALDWEALELR